MKLRTSCVFTLFVLLLLAPAAHAKKKDEFKFSGRLGLGLQDDDEDDEESKFELRLQASSPRKKGFKAVVELRASEDAHEVAINDAYVDYRNPDKTNRVRFGRGKKILGFEYEYPQAARLTAKRSQPYKYLGERSLVGRDYFISFAHIDWKDNGADDEDEAESANPAAPAGDTAPEQAGTEPKAVPRDLETLTDSSYYDPSRLVDADEDWKFEISGHMNEVDDVSLIFSALHTLGSHFRLGAWVMGSRMKSVSTVQGVWTGVLSGVYQEGIQRAMLELFYGVDPYRTELNQNYSDGLQIRFGSVRAEYGLYLNRFNPYVSGAVLWRDFANRGEHDFEGIGGLRYFLTSHLNVVGEGGLSSSVGVDPTVPAYHDIVGRLFVRYYF